MNGDNERVLALVAALLIGALLGSPMVAWIRSLLRAVGQLAVFAVLAIAVWLLIERVRPGQDASPPSEPPPLPTTPIGAWWESP